MKERSVVVLMATVAFVTQGAIALYCARCSSLDNPLCAIGFVPPTKCQSHQRVCMTYIGRMPEPGSDVVIRDCADGKLVSFCTLVNPVDPPPPPPPAPSSGFDALSERDMEAANENFQHEICVRSCRLSNCNNEPHGAVFPYIH